jgi:hypothetical protein
LSFYFLGLNSIEAQSYHQQKRQLFTYNVLLNGFIGGIGGVINKSKGEKPLVVFGRNFLKGALGGMITYQAKYQLYQLKRPENFWYAPLIRAGYYVGYSFTYNASLNRSIFNSYHSQFYLFNFDMQFKGGVRVLPRISVLSALSAGGFVVLGDKLDLKNSLRYGLFYFRQNGKYELIRDGLGLHNSIEIISEDQKSFTPDLKYSAIAHEMVHTFQFPDYFSISNLYAPSIKRATRSNGYRKLSNYFFLDIPYFPLLYVFQNKYRENFYEFEAYHFEMRSYVER